MEKDLQSFSHVDPEFVKALSFCMGMSYNLLDEPQIMADILNKTTEQMAVYADVVSKRNYNDIDFLENQLSLTYMEKIPAITDVAFNPTSIGNMAYLAAYSPEPYAARSKHELNLILDAYARKIGVDRTTSQTDFTSTSFCVLI